MDSVGNLALRDLETGSSVWSAQTQGAGYAKLDELGGFHVYDANDAIVWSAKTKGGNHVYFDVEPLRAAVSEDLEPSSTVIEYWRSDGNGGSVYGGGPCTIGRWSDLMVGTTLHNREYLCHSPDVVFGVNPEGNLGLFDVSGADSVPIWSAGTFGENVHAVLEESGRLAVHSTSADGVDTVLWHSNTRGGDRVSVDGDSVENVYASIVDTSGVVSMTYWRTDVPGHLLHGGGACTFGFNHNSGMTWGDFLGQGEFLCSYQNMVLGFDDDGDFALFYMDSGERKKIWCAGTSGQSNAFRLSIDGELQVYDIPSGAFQRESFQEISRQTGALLWTQATSTATQWIEIKENFEHPELSVLQGKETYLFLDQSVDRVVWDSSEMPPCVGEPVVPPTLIELLLQLILSILCALTNCESGE